MYCVCVFGHKTTSRSQFSPTMWVLGSILGCQAGYSRNKYKKFILSTAILLLDFI